MFVHCRHLSSTTNFKFDQSVFAIHDSPPHILRSMRMTNHSTLLVTYARDHWWTLDFANAFVSPGVNSRTELVPSPRAYARNGAPRRWLGENVAKLDERDMLHLESSHATCVATKIGRQLKLRASETPFRATWGEILQNSENDNIIIRSRMPASSVIRLRIISWTWNRISVPPPPVSQRI
jgi:hypothetical protein